MCSIRNNWQQYAYSILLLICILVSNSSQQKLINQPQPFQRLSKSVGEDANGFKPVAVPLNHRQIAPVDVKFQNGLSSQTKSAPTLQAIAQVDEPIDKTANDEERSINISAADLEDLAWELMKEAMRNGNGAIQKRSADQSRAALSDIFFSKGLINGVKKFAENYIFKAASASSFKDLLPTSGRLFLFKGIY